MKRMFDIVFSAAGLAGLWPIILGCMIAIRLESRGPALFRQLRVGRHGKLFLVLPHGAMLLSEGRLDSPGLTLNAPAASRMKGGTGGGAKCP
jgi:lipopolysaccharide/colanic/teichoic acid biosynthesis glycosyltransferase